MPVAGRFATTSVLGADGARRDGIWADVACFRRVQRRWAVGGIVARSALAALVALRFLGVRHVLPASDPHRLGLEATAADARPADRLGQPIDGGAAQGSIEMSGQGGNAGLTARRTRGTWTFTALRVTIDRDAEAVDVVPAPGRL